MDAPNVVSLIDVIRHPVEQTVGGGGTGGLPGLHPGQSSTAFGEADHRVPPATAEQNVDIPAPRGGASRFSSKSSSCSWFFRFAPILQINGFFALFPVGKKCEDNAHPGVGPAHGLRELSWWSCPLAPALMAARASWGTTWGDAASSWSSWQAWYWRVRFLSGPPSFRRSWQPR